MEDARLSGDARALEGLGAELAERLGVAAAGGDEYGLWLRFEVACIPGAGDPVGEAAQVMRWCWPGSYLRGADGPEAYDPEQPQHRVLLTRGFWLGDTPVTQTLWQAVMGDNPSRFVTPERPVELVSWDDAQRFCEQLRQRIPLLGARLPSQAEWEYAARAGTTTPRYGALNDIAWYEFNSHEDFEGVGRDEVGGNLEGHQRGTHPVKTKLPNPWGYYDMLGNVWEWCEDTNQDNESAAVAERHNAVAEQNKAIPATWLDPLSTGGSKRVFRGASWRDDAVYVRVEAGGALTPRLRDVDIGFRLSSGRAPSIK